MELTPQEYHAAIVRILSVLNRFDLMSLEPGRRGGAPDDEYTPEAAAIVQVMVRHGEIDADQLRHTWLEWFTDDLSRLPGAVVRELVRALNEEFRSFRNE